MDTADVLRAHKTNIHWSNWSDEPPKKAAYPMSHRRGEKFPLTRQWRWCRISFETLSRSFVAIVAYHKIVPDFRASLAELVQDNTRTILRFEYHGNEPVPGWHIHTNCGDVSLLEMGMTKPFGQIRLLGARSHHRCDKYCLVSDAMDDRIAEALAAKRFGVPFSSDLFGKAVRA